MAARWRAGLLIISCTILRAVLCHAADASSSAHGATDLNNQGVTAAQAGEFELGVSCLRQALQANPNDPLEIGRAHV